MQQHILQYQLFVKRNRRGIGGLSTADGTAGAPTLLKRWKTIFDQTPGEIIEAAAARKEIASDLSMLKLPTKKTDVESGGEEQSTTTERYQALWEDLKALRQECRTRASLLGDELRIKAKVFEDLATTNR